MTTKKNTQPNAATDPTQTLARETRAVPLSSLYLHPLNPRQSVSAEEIDALALSLDSIGLMQNLLGIEEKGECGRSIGIVAGGRRLRAARRMIETQELDPDRFLIPVKLAKDAAEAETWANAENTARAALHPAAEIEGYRRMVETGADIRTIAKAFAVTERHVTGRLKLAGLASEVLAALKADAITLDQAAAFAISDCHKAQVEVLAELQRWDRDPRDIRAMLTEDATREGHGLARFVTRAEYEAAGGAVREDLFGTEVYFEDGDVLQQAAHDKLTAIAETVKSEGWKWVDVLSKGTLPYDTLAEYQRTYGVQADISEAEEAEYNALAAEIEAESATDEQVERFDRLEEMLATEIYSDAQRAVAGVVIGFDYNFQPRIERGLIASEDRKVAVEAGVIRGKATGDSETPPKDKDAYSAALERDLVAIRTAAVQQALLDNPALALDLLAFAMSTDIYSGSFPLDIKPGHPSRKPTVEDGFDPDPRLRDNDRLTLPLGTAEATKRFTAFRKKPQAERSAILTEAIAGCVGGGLAGKGANAVFETVATETVANVRAVWTPTENGFFKRRTVSQLDAIYCQLLGKKDAGNFVKKKGAKAAYLHALFNDPKFLAEQDKATQARVAVWVPKGMETAAKKKTPAKRTSAKTAPAKRGPDPTRTKQAA